MSGAVRSGCIVRDVIAQEQQRTHIHCDSCELIGCNGIALREAMPAKDPSPDWVRQARMEGRAEFVSMLVEMDPEMFVNEYIGSHAIGDTGDYGEHWERHKIAELFEVNEPALSLIERVDGAYWSQQNEIGNLKDQIKQLKEDAARLDWLEKNPNIQRAAGKTLRETIDKAIDDEERAKESE